MKKKLIQGCGAVIGVVVALLVLVIIGGNLGWFDDVEDRTPAVGATPTMTALERSVETAIAKGPPLRNAECLTPAERDYYTAAWNEMDNFERARDRLKQPDQESDAHRRMVGRRG